MPSFVTPVMRKPATVDPAPGLTEQLKVPHPAAVPEMFVGDPLALPRLGSSPMRSTPVGTLSGKSSPLATLYVPGLTKTVWPLLASESALVMVLNGLAAEVPALPSLPAAALTN